MSLKFDKRIVALSVAVTLMPLVASAHGVTRGDARSLQNLQGAAIGPLMYLGAKHMVTGYDHLLFLVGVIFFLYRPKDVVQDVSLFTIGHSVTLLAGVRRHPRQSKQESDRASGALTAAFAGIHGWYFENPSDQELTIAMNSAGFFSSAEELRPRFDPAKHKDFIESIPHELSEPKPSPLSSR
ncbi:MAG: hypothetical protein AUJ01_10910 [Acidobacteria bacterium 13_1_40CM_3_65_5]|nr:MAG: hypothetical protein AUJ01_10910 [Acidobacteria bacterium 13_1_40CM_3_65_5]